MVLITEDLIRKKSEHNEKMISTLEEVSLHQEDIEKIEHIQNWCRDLKILLLQSNLISKIENLHKLKKLEYLNMAINNIERIENLEKLESLNKLDLTLNFIGEVTSVESLKENYNLKHLYLTGNPCTDYPEYRMYVVGALQQLETLDGEEIKPSDKLRARRAFGSLRESIIQAQAMYRVRRDEQKIRVQEKQQELEEDMEGLDEEERTKLFWDSESEHCPETRWEMAKHHRKNKKLEEVNEIEKMELKLFAPCGRPYNLNQPKLKFRFEDEQNKYKVEVEVYKFLDTSLIDVDIQPNYVRVTVKGKILQLALSDEVNASGAILKRSTTTGRLLITIPKVLKADGIFDLRSRQSSSSSISSGGSTGSSAKGTTEGSAGGPSGDEESNLKGTVNYKNIVKPTGKQLAASPQVPDEQDIPALV